MNTEQFFSPGVRQRFLEALSRDGVIGNACRAVGVSRSTVAKYREEDPAFAEAFADAMEAGVDWLETAAIERAVNGVTEPVFYKGEIVGEIQRYSDSLLSMLLTRKRYPEKIKQEHTGADGGPMQMITAEKRASLIASLLEKARARKDGNDLC